MIYREASTKVDFNMKWTRMVAILYEAPKKSSAGIKENILLSYN